MSTNEEIPIQSKPIQNDEQQSADSEHNGRKSRSSSSYVNSQKLLSNSIRTESLCPDTEDSNISIRKLKSNCSSLVSIMDPADTLGLNGSFNTVNTLNKALCPNVCHMKASSGVCLCEEETDPCHHGCSLGGNNIQVRKENKHDVRNHSNIQASTFKVSEGMYSLA